MKFLNCLLLGGVFCCALAASSQAEDAAPAPTAGPAKEPDYANHWSKILKPTRSLVYKQASGRDLELHIFEPEGWKASDRRPCYLAIHGGGWVAGTPTIMYPVAKFFADRGWFAVSMQYRLHKPEKGTTAWDSVKDARSAIRYLRVHADELGIDPNKIVVGGRSAGGHLSAATAMFEIDESGEDLSVSCVPNVMCLYSPVIDTSADGYGHELLGERWKELSPLHHVRSGLPPTLLLHGKRDTITPFAGAEQFAAAMTKAGNRCEFVADDRGSHSYMMRTEALFTDAMQRTIDLCAEVGIESPNAK